MKDPLEDFFDMNGDEGGSFTVEIPEDPQLDDIISFSLKEYKGLRDIIELIEPKNRIKYYEMMERFLANAKDAMHKKETLRMAREKVKATKKTTEEPKKEDEGKTFSRSELSKLRAVK
jgi:hypothetical protein